jgi:hypothetical protein
MPKRSQDPTTLRVTLCAVFFFLCTLIAAGQSGRQIRRPTPAPVPIPEPAPTTPKPAEQPKPGLTFIIGMDRFGAFSRIPLSTYTAVLNSCANRLDEPDFVKVETLTRDISRADAVRRAKSEKEAYVVWLELRPDTSSGRAETNDDRYNVYIEYSVFAPTTAKQAASGRAYPGAYRNGGVILQPKTRNIGDYYLLQAAKETADSILKHFHVGERNLRPSQSRSQRAIPILMPVGTRP